MKRILISMLLSIAILAVSLRAEDKPKPNNDEAKELLEKMMDDISGLGSSNLADRKSALETIRQSGAQMLPVMLGMLGPKQTTDEFTRIGILRYLQEVAPLDDKASKVIAFTAVFDPYIEVRREACRLIRKLQDDVCMSEIARYASNNDGGVRRNVAFAAHEIDDNRLYYSIIRAIPQPEVNANAGDVHTRIRSLPTGLGGLNVPVMTGTQDVAGTAANTDSPAAELMRNIAGKNMGSNSTGWLVWYGEKVGQVGSVDYEDARLHHGNKPKVDSSTSTPSGATPQQP
jgi:hypothetical protein